jgi:oligopeptide/dipeptide ABC transporter ATP-binding protein
MMSNNRVLEVEGLSTTFGTRERGVKAVREFGITVEAGQMVGLVGESGSGKSVSMMSVAGLVQHSGGWVSSGSVKFKGQDMLAMSRSELRRFRGKHIGMIFQDPMTSLNPVMPIGHQITEPMRRYLDLRGKAARRRAIELLNLVRLPEAERRLGQYPHELSGGMRQRVMIAMAMACDPELLIADEPTTALDVTVQAQILELIKDAASERSMSVILISHDLGVIAGVADRVQVMYYGRVVESGTVYDVLQRPRHPYTIGLLNSSPRPDQGRQSRLEAIPGTPPDLDRPPTGCAFLPRCRYGVSACGEIPPLSVVGDSDGPGDGQHVACWVDVANASNEGH